jgi:predicted hotdog family 3-hydroxylacyl-ACP dehydratase
MIDRAAILAMIPHQGGMCLLDGVLAWNEHSLHAFSDSHRHADNPLRREGRLSALHLCEFGAQAMAVHGGLLAARSGGRARPGMLVSLRGVELHCERIDDLLRRLDVHATLLQAGETSQQYEFRIEHEGILLASGRAAVMLQPEAT